VGGDELLLLAQSVEEAEGVHAKAGDRHDRERGERAARGQRQPRSLAGAGRAQYQEWDHQSRRGLDTDTGHERGNGRARTRGRVDEIRWLRLRPARTLARGVRHRTAAGAQRQCAGQRQQHERVVVRAADRQLQQHRVQPDEHGRRLGRAAHAPRRLSGQSDRAEARRHGCRLQRPQAAPEAEQGQRVGAEREQRAVRGVLKWPADERKHGVDGRFGGDMRVGVETVQDAQAREREVAEDVL
jgi:hypothetical protein